MTRIVDLEKLYRSATELQEFHQTETVRLQLVRGQALRELRKSYDIQELVDKWGICRQRINFLIKVAKDAER